MKNYYVSGLILSGGRSSRMGHNDKGLVLLNGKAMIEYVNKILMSQVDEVIISANQNLELYKYLNHRILSDEYNDFRGPLAGIYEGLKVIAKDSFLLVVPCDGPLFPADLSKRMLEIVAATGCKLVTVYDGTYRQPTYSLIHQSLKESLQQFLDNGERKLGKWLSDNQAQLVDFSDQAGAFANINTEADLVRLEQNTDRI